MSPIKFMSYFLIFILILNIIFLATGMLDTLWFFIVIIVISLISWKGMPYMKKKGIN